jgi:AhpD family alkylhydroperoxidase
MLGDLVDRHGTVGDMVRTMAHSPAVLGGYLELSKAMKRAKLARPITERISLAVQQHQDCDLCLAAHTAAARAVGVEDDEIELAKKGTSTDPAIAAIVAFGLQVHTAPATITDHQLAELHRHGYSDREIADVVGLIALNVLTGAFNLVAGLHPETEAR